MILVSWSARVRPGERSCADRHRDGRLVDGDQGQRDGVLGVGQGLTDGDVGDAGIATMSPGPASSPGLRSSASVTRSSVIFMFCCVPSRFIQATVWFFFSVPCARAPGRAGREWTGVEVGDVCLQGLALGVEGAGSSRIVRNSGSRSAESGTSPLAGDSSEALPARAWRRRPGSPAPLAVGVVEQVHEQLVRLVDHLGDAGVRAVGLVDHQDHRHVAVERLAQHEPGLRERSLARVDEQHDPVDHREARSTSPPKSAWPGCR